MATVKQDRSGVRTPVDVERRHKLGLIKTTAEEVEEIREEFSVDSSLSVSSTHPVENKVITEALANKVNVEIGKGLSTNDFTNNEKNKLEGIETGAEVNKLDSVSINGEELTITNKGVNIYVDGYMSDYSTNPVQNKIVKEYIDNNSGGSTSYFLSNYAVDGLDILRSSCVVKNDRVCINFVGTLSMDANTTTTLFNLPSAIRPFETRDFVVFGQSSNTTGYIGYGFITSDGLLQVRFNDDVTSYIRFSVTYDLY